MEFSSTADICCLFVHLTVVNISSYVILLIILVVVHILINLLYINRNVAMSMRSTGLCELTFYYCINNTHWNCTSDIIALWWDEGVTKLCTWIKWKHNSHSIGIVSSLGMVLNVQFMSSILFPSVLFTSLLCILSTTTTCYIWRIPRQCSLFTFFTIHIFPFCGDADCAKTAMLLIRQFNRRRS